MIDSSSCFEQLSAIMIAATGRRMRAPTSFRGVVKLTRDGGLKTAVRILEGNQ